MMEKKGSLVVPTDWRAEIKNETRLKVVDTICAKLKEQWPGYSPDATILKQITDLAMKFEKEMFIKAKSKDQYINFITRKMSRIENRHESSSIQDHPAFSSDKSVVQMKKEEVSVSQPLPQMSNQPCQQPAAPNPRYQQPAAPNPRYQQPAAPNLLLRQNIQQLTPQPHEKLHRQKLNARQTHQQFGMHNQSCVRTQNTLNSPCQPLGLQSRDAGIHMSPEMFTPHSKVLNLQPNENFTAQIKKEVMGEDFQASTFLQQHPNVNGQHKQHQSTGGSAVPIENSNVEDWHDQAYFEMQSFKGTYLPLLKEAYEKASKQCLLVQTEHVQKYKNHMGLMRRMMIFMELPRNRIVYYTKEKFYRTMQSIAQYIRFQEKQNINLVNNQQTLHGQPGLSQSRINPVQRSDNVNSHFQPGNLATTGSSDSSSPIAPREMGYLRPEANRIQKNLLQKRQHSEIMKQDFQSPWIQQKQKSTENIQAINRTGVSSEYHLNSKYSPQTHEAPQLSQIAGRALQKDPGSSSCGGASPTPSSITIGLGKKSSNVSCLSSLNFQYPQTRSSVNFLNNKTEIQVQSHEIRSSGTSTISRLAEPTSLASNQLLLTETQPMNRLIKAVDSISNEALRAAVSEMSSVWNMNDTITEPALFKTRCHQKAAHLSLQDGCGSSNNMKRKISATTLNDMSSPFSDIDGSEPTVTSRSKKPKKLTDNALLDEMRKINQRLVETVLELDSAENVNSRFANAGTVLRCSYTAVSDGKNLKFHFANTQKLPVLSVKLLVPVDYPKDYPVFLSRFITGCCTEDEESGDLSRKATSMLRALLRTAPKCLSLEDYARAWDQCARAVVSEYAQRVGGGCFSSRYGTWEDCVIAT